ncbi:hypothetical protein CH25_gp56 [Mycobacterium phage EagleEye]|uniref:Uncharacterized protein n=1 Tax=Mycobacterium phage EagleEye TaxID=1429759 RepID=W0LNW2_9CAUD|nr:hypothetical protein CH25_gp56 [Mycobacterium phage EagleEye]AHG23830.1 hypothetical protein PBI_EAGLEEYE_50 [Mycobacterium phage EagleEye]QDK03483.1 hypothetical protein SEA_LUCYEDI_49 [Mycobacterium phage Lucyedi]QNJ55872.1 hypothetical protein SEA_PAINTERBOY_49 [Mycobacterium phage PainterBoy]
MSRRATAIWLSTNRFVVVAGEPMQDEKTLVINYEDGTSRIFNWDYVVDYYYMTEDEYEAHRKEREQGLE